ncbi:MAG: DUF3341 domain-containing protein [Phycisphaerales bacterium]|nr:DUF3341 domain-containing protein [Phycisphaerales bacterium]
MASAPDQTGAAALWGLAAEFSDPAAVSHAAEAVRDAGYTRWDVLAPFPIHGIDKAMGLKPSRVSFFVGFGAFLGLTSAILMQGWMGGIDYKIIVGGKPLLAWEQSMPIMFELSILFGGIAAILGMFLTNGLPMWYHPVLKTPALSRASDDKFFVVIESADPKFDRAGVEAMLRGAGALNVEEVER